MKLSIGVIIGICLIVYWWMQDHPRTAAPAPVAPVTQGWNAVAPDATA